jgi:hypothetical protein
MKQQIKRKNRIVALCYLVFGLVMLYQSVMFYDIGTFAQMQAGFFPLIGSGLIVLAGFFMLLKEVFVAFRAKASDGVRHSAHRGDWSELFIVLVFTVILLTYALAIHYLGLMASITLLVISSRVFYPESSWRLTLIGLVLCTALSYLLVEVIAPSGVMLWPDFIGV